MQPLTFQNSKIFVEDVETTDPEIIGYAVQDFVSQNPNKKIKLIAE